MAKENSIPQNYIEVSTSDQKRKNERLLQEIVLILSQWIKRLKKIKKKFSAEALKEGFQNLSKKKREELAVFYFDELHQDYLSLKEKIIDITGTYRRLQDLKNKKVPKEQYGVGCDDVLNAFDGEPIRRILADMGMKVEEIVGLNEDIEYVDKRCEELSVSAVVEGSAEMSFQVLQIEAILESFWLVELKKFKKYLERRLTTVDLSEKEKETINELLKIIILEVKKSDPMPSKQFNSIIENPELQGYYQKFVDEKTKNLLNKQFKLIEKKSPEQLELRGLYNKLKIHHQLYSSQISDNQVKASMKVFLDALSMMTDPAFTCNKDEKVLIRSVISNANAMLQTGFTDSEYQALMETQGHLIEKVNNKAQKNAESGFWKQLRGSMLILIGVAVVTLSIALGALILPFAVAAGVAGIIGAGLLVSSAIVSGFYAVNRGAFFCNKGRELREKSTAFEKLSESMSAMKENVDEVNPDLPNLSI